MNILIVEDSVIIRRVIAKVVKANGFTPLEAENGADGLVKLRKHYSNIWLVVLDWNMPIMDGFEVLTRMRATPEYDRIPILMATADGAEDDVVKALKAGANSYLVKPFAEEALSERIKELLPNRPGVSQ
ncbi:MAG: response regulator [candidate division Zixibacteria bacterium]|nr:response regulator [candidate division Zixibacteria bacterium]